MELPRVLVLELLDLLRAHERYQLAQDIVTMARDRFDRFTDHSPLTMETSRLREELEQALADAPPS